jgi:hypothetical protein
MLNKKYTNTEICQVNLSLIKDIVRTDSLDNLHYYLIIKNYYFQRSGLFSIDELLNLLHANYNYKTLSTNPGNQRARYKKQLEPQLDTSILFRRVPDGRYIINGSRQFQFRKNKKIQFLYSDLSTSRQFFDGLIYGIVTSRPFAGITETAQILKVSDRRISYGIDRLIKTGRIKKIQNLIIPETPAQESKKSINKLRYTLFKEHGILTPKPVFFKGVRYFALFWKNSFYVAGSQKEDRHLKLTQDFPLTLISDAFNKYRLWQFNSQSYSFDRYIEDYGFKNL